MKKPKFKFIDLFAGIGGFHFALESLGGECVFASDWDSNAQKTYSHNFKMPVTGDITKVRSEDVPDHDVLCAGFPCQPFSIAGKQEGFQHATQGTLFFDVLRIVKDKRPKVLFLENVRNLASHDEGRTLKVILESINELGYEYSYAILNASEHGGIPQNRERIYIVAFRDAGMIDKFSFPGKNGKLKPLFSFVPKEDGILKLWEKKADKYYQTNEASPSVKKMKEGVTEKGVVYQYRRFYMRDNKSGVCPTLTANMGTGGHNVPLILDDFGIRKLTENECVEIMGFPEGFSFPEGLSSSACYKQSGNSVVVPVITAIAENFVKLL